MGYSYADIGCIRIMYLDPIQKLLALANMEDESTAKMPKETVGLCSRKKCNNYTSLGNGYCLECWDEGFGFDAQLPSHYANLRI